MADGYYLSESDLAVLKEMLAWYKRQPGNTQNRHGDSSIDFADHPAPEVYVAFTPLAGIPALVDATPGSATCDIYRILNGVLVPAGSPLQRTVYNISQTTVVGGTYVKVERDKWGSWVTEAEAFVVIPACQTLTYVSKVCFSSQQVEYTTYDPKNCALSQPFCKTNPDTCCPSGTSTCLNPCTSVEQYVCVTFEFAGTCAVYGDGSTGIQRDLRVNSASSLSGAPYYEQYGYRLDQLLLFTDSGANYEILNLKLYWSNAYCDWVLSFSVHRPDDYSYVGLSLNEFVRSGGSTCPTGAMTFTGTMTYSPVSGGTPVPTSMCGTPITILVTPGTCAEHGTGTGTGTGTTCSISRSNLGTVSNLASTTLTKAAVTIPANSLLTVALMEVSALLGASPTMTWNGLPMTNRGTVIYTGGAQQIRISQFNLFSAAGGTGSIVASMAGPYATALAAIEELGLSADTYDKTGNNSGASGAPTVTISGTTTADCEYVQASAVTINESGSTAMTGGFTQAQSASVLVLGNTYTLLEGYLLQTAAGTPSTSWSGLSTSGWVALIGSNK